MDIRLIRFFAAAGIFAFMCAGSLAHAEGPLYDGAEEGQSQFPQGPGFGAQDGQSWERGTGQGGRRQYPGQGGDHHQGQRMIMEKKGGSMHGILNHLGLSDEQRAALHEKREAQIRSSQETRKKLQEKRRELKDALDNLDVDEANIDALITEITTLSSENLKSRVQSILDIKEILTPEQYNELKSRMKEGKAGFKQSRGKGRGFDGGGQRHKQNRRQGQEGYAPPQE